MKHFSYEGGCDVCISRQAWAMNKHLQFSNNVVLKSSTTKLPKNKAILSSKLYCIQCYVVLSYCNV